MRTFTFNGNTADRLMNDLNEGRIVKLTKANGSAIILQHGNDRDEFGDFIYRFTIETTGNESQAKNLPVNQEDMLNFIFGEEFAEYLIVEK